MAVSSNSIIHYTRNFNNIKKIIKEKSFRLKYCNEKISFNKSSLEYAVPMVSFCDIPFGNIETQIKEYGNYGIGMKKEWAVKNKLNPVIYLESNSMLNETFHKLFQLVTDQNIADNSHKDFFKLFDYFWEILCFLKTYSGDIYVSRDSRTINNYRFYDEREWRYVCMDSKILEQMILKEQYEKEEIELNKKAFEIKIPFETKDVSYIVLEKESQVSTFLNYLRKEVDINIDNLCNKIITIEQLKNDF